ncbi:MULTISPECIES: PTS glucose transporter subunit IIA [unclassified Staphylococcus]|uniref:PTS sugar transporter subunit IIA n=1 Tax=unclassified Staphylococcus TaxID=91994 RepID=UPI0021CE5E75|nr:MULTISPECIES: PTS glucose transporter subunit IIA [unclassified Staphylococcus]UXR76437.1 PTS glucose transporter subunit IIA [Staphylococcus sp. IVB6233]UXR80564.1 PTS glucose transporter subunit IIA [Staphylococcus sp. IVB6218]
MTETEADDKTTVQTEQTTTPKTAVDSVNAPLSGRILPLTSVSDPVFSSLAMGQGVAVQPSSNLITAPFDATVESLFPTGHAIGLKSVEGTELLIHIGIDTVKLEGQGFKPLVEQGATVTKGQPLIEFDSSTIKEHGYDNSVIIVVTNTPVTQEIIVNDSESVTEKDNLLKVIY